MEDAPVKPDPAPVKLALEQLKCKTGIMFGDTVDDARAAVGAGITAAGVRFLAHFTEIRL
jgi:phosphoglycolate phosphatase-like HAD superfamily hydrolase